MQRGPREKKERSLGERLQLRPQRCASPKCAAVRRPYRPGQHGQKGRRKAPSDFGRQISEKQKFKVTYGLNEHTLRRMFEMADRSGKGTSSKLMELFERRLDNVLFRMGLAPSRLAARQSVVQGHVNVNGARTRSPGFQVVVGDTVAIRDVSKSSGAFRNLHETLKQYEPPAWVSVDRETLQGKVVALPSEDSPFEINLVVESFSK